MLAYVLLGLAAISAVSADCSIDMNKDLPKHKSPLFIGADGELMLPKPRDKTGFLELKDNEEVTLACPGKKNQISSLKEVVASATCSSGDKLNVGNKAVSIGSLGCSKTASSELKVTDQSCHNGAGTHLELGFDVDGKWYKLVDVCHQMEAGHTLFTNHTVQGGAINGAEVESKRPSFTRGDSALYKGTDPNKLYKQTNHFAMLEKVLGAKTAKDLKAISYLARGHLAPDADFIFGSWQFLTYFYANVAPQWQSINAGNWLATEKNVRSKAAELGRDLSVYTGTEGVLELPDESGKLTQLYLEDDMKMVPIPRHFWKVLYDDDTQQGIAIVSTNNPLLENTNNPLCEDICEDNGWPSYKSDLTKGHVFCCTVEALREKVDYVPDLKISGIMQGPK